MRADLLLLAADLAKRGEAFARATVVRREPPSSARVGDSALITQGGAFHGWLGGSCTQPIVVREALAALTDGAPRLIALCPDPESDRRPGVAAFPMTCHSGGSVDIYIEPLLPAPRLVIVGVSPVAQALARLAKVMGYAIDAVDPEADRATFPEADRVFTSFDGSQLRPPIGPGVRGTQLLVVVATMGQRDAQAIQNALAIEPAYLGVVASRRRFEELGTALRAQGVAAADLEVIKSPAGLDIGAHTPQEIALSILAEIVHTLRAGTGAPRSGRGGAGDRGERAGDAPPPATERDPVCGMSVATASAAYRAEVWGRTFYFCGQGCRERFLTGPERYAEARRAGGPA